VHEVVRRTEILPELAVTPPSRCALMTLLLFSVNVQDLDWA